MTQAAEIDPPLDPVVAEPAARKGVGRSKPVRLTRLALRRGRRAVRRLLAPAAERLAPLKGTPVHHGALLAGFALAAAWLLAASDSGTREAIAQRAAEDLQRSLERVAPATHREGPFRAATMTTPETGDRVIYQARKEGFVSAIAFKTSAPGYAGPIELLLGVDREGRLLGVRVLAHSETPGLGDKIEAEKSDWPLSFDGRALGDPPVEQWKVKKDGGVFDQFSGATVTPRAVVAAIREGLEFFARHKAAILELRPDPEEARKP